MGNTSAHKKGLYIKILKAESKMWQVKSRCRNSFLLPAPVLCKKREVKIKQQKRNKKIKIPGILHV